MVKKVISVVLITGLIAASASAFACSCGGADNKIYEYVSRNNGTHTVSSYCQNEGCEDPLTVHRTEACTYEWVEYEDPNTWVISWVEQCTLCGHIK